MADLASDRVALVALYDATNGDNWIEKTNWKATASVCDWYRVKCNSSKTNVIKIMLISNNLTGTIPSEIGDLTKLEWLYFRDNNLTGTIPRDIVKLTNLEYLYLENNNLTGTIPKDIGNMTNLKFLSLHSNNLIGTIPNSIKKLHIFDKYLQLYENCSLRTEDQSVIDFLNDNTLLGYQHILNTDGNCRNMSTVYYLLLD